MNILLVEPDLFLGKIYKQALENLGNEVAWAKSAQQAVVLADENKPDIVVMEIQMPRHNGIEFLYEFRSYSEWQSIPVVLHTLASYSTNWIESIDDLGVLDYLYKPATSLKQLADSVRRVLASA